MKTKTPKQPKQSKPAVQLEDIKLKKDAKGGGNTKYSNGMNVCMGDGSVR